ncbi:MULTISPECIES: hypothetical protein [unclassified Sinorhizobium]|uniref:hypothetical protein n=1 Tax=unclassified Sinorhizobium TaxID=2613772 RepID=UPI0035265703
MSRIYDYGAAADPLQRGSGIATVKAEQFSSSHSPLHDGFVATAPRLVAVFVLAGVVQTLMSWMH